MSDKPSGPTEAQELIKDKFRQSGNMARILGAQTGAPGVTGVAEGNAAAAAQAAADQDARLRGTPPQESRAGEMLQTPEQPPEGGGGEADQPTEELIPKPVFLQRVAREVERRRAAEAELEALREERMQPQRVQQPQHEVPEIEFDPSDPMQASFAAIREENREIRSLIGTMLTNNARERAIAQLGGNQDLYTLVNDYYRDGQSGLSLEHSLVLLKHDNPQLFGGGVVDDGREGPAYQVGAPRSAESGNRHVPDERQTREQDLLAKIAEKMPQSDRTQLGKQLMRERIGKHNIFGGQSRR